MPSSSFFGFLDRALRCLEAEAPAAHRELVGSLGRLRPCLVADGLGCTVAYEERGWVFQPRSDQIDIEIAFEREVVIDLVDGRLTIEQAIEGERLRVLGSVDHVERLHSALLLFLGGLLRAPSANGLLEDYRSSS